MVGRLGLLAVAALLLSAADHVAAQNRENSSGVFSLGVAGVATPEPNTLSVAAPLANITNRAVADVKINRIRLATAPAETPLPIAVGAVGARSSAIVQARFNDQSLRSGQRYELVMEGTYRGEKDEARRFNVHTSVVMPPPSEGSGRLGTAQVPPHKVEGGRYPHRPPRMDKDVNSGAPPVPTNPAVPGAPTPAGTEAQRAPIGDPPAIRFDRNNAVGITGAGLGCSGDSAAACAEPSGASGNGVIFLSANWSIAFSTDGGSTFTVLDPTTIFPNMRSASAATRLSSTRLRSTASSGFCRAPAITSPWPVLPISRTATARRGPIGT